MENILQMFLYSYSYYKDFNKISGSSIFSSTHSPLARTDT